jgi:hypothetical protein
MSVDVRMGLFSQFVGALKRGREAAKASAPFKPPFEELAQLYTATTEDLRTDAAFKDSEEFAFMLGEKIDTRGWIIAAQWDGQTQVMQLWTETHGPYDFPGIDTDGARVFAKSDSKGAWFWGVYKRRAKLGRITTKRGHARGKVGQATPLFRTVIRKKR